MLTRFSLLFLCLMLFFKLGQAQKTWTLEDCIAYAMTHNIDLQKVGLNNERNEENYKQTIRNLLPSIYTDIGFRPSFGKSIDPNTNDIIFDPHFSNTYSAGTSIGIFQGFRRINQIKFSKTILEAGLFDEKAFRTSLSFNIMDAFFNLLFYKGLMSISIELIEQSQWNKRFVEGMIRNGLKAESDILEVEADLASEQLKLLRAQNEYEQGLLRLKQLINLDRSEAFIINDRIPEISDRGQLNHSIDSIYRTALTSYPNIQSSKARVVASQISLANTKSYLYPTLGFGAGIYTGYYQTNKNMQGDIIPFAEQLATNASQYLSVSFGIPLNFNQGMNRSRTKLARINLKESELNLKQEEQKLYQSIQQDWQKLAALRLEIEQGEIQVQARQAAELTIRRKFEKGLANQYEFSMARNQLALAKSELLNTSLQYEITRRTMNYYKGLPISGTQY